MAFPKADVCIIGAGAAGGIASYVLAQAGLRVVGLEAGPNLDKSNFKMDELDGWFGRNAMGEIKANKEIPTRRRNTNEKAVRSGAVHPMMNAVGGSSIHWCGQAWRFHPDDFQVRTNTIKRYGAAALPAGTDIQDWPITYDELEPYYDKVEYATGISGKAGNLKGQTINGGNVFEGPRQREYPLPPLPDFCLGGLFTQAARRLGYHPFPGPAAIISRSYDGRPGCTFCGWCCSFGCHIDAKSSTHVSTIPKALATGNFDLRPLSRVMRLNVDDKGDVKSVTYLDAAGAIQEQEARLFILAAYTYENVRLLLTSTSDLFPRGLSNNAGMVGKYYFSQANWDVNGIFPQKLNLFAGPLAQAVDIDDFNADNFDHSGLGFIRGTHVCARNQLLPIQGSRVLPPGTPAWGQEYKDFIRQNFNRMSGINSAGSGEVLPYDANYLDLDPEVKDPLGMPVIRITFDMYDNEKKMCAFVQDKAEAIMEEMGATNIWKTIPGVSAASNHAQGGTRMGNDPRRSVVDRWCRCHEVPNLFIFSGSVHVTTSGFNPTENIQALAWRGSEEVIRQLK